MDNSRRSFIKKATLAGLAILAGPGIYGASHSSRKYKVSDAAEPFKLKYVPGS